jgi:hypothetical protein
MGAAAARFATVFPSRCNHRRETQLASQSYPPGAIKKLSKPVSGDMMIARVGRISANSGATTGDLIAEAM